MSQAELARRAAVSRKWIYEFEAGKPTAEFGLLLRVIDALDLDLVLSTRMQAADESPANAIDLDVLLGEHRRDDG